MEPNETAGFVGKQEHRQETVFLVVDDGKAPYTHLLLADVEVD
jgi:hypothetical protein